MILKIIRILNYNKMKTTEMLIITMINENCSLVGTTVEQNEMKNTK